MRSLIKKTISFAKTGKLSHHGIIMCKIDKKRLAKTFVELVTIDSLSREEKNVATYVTACLKTLGAEIIEDDSKAETGSNCNNIIARFKGTRQCETIFFNAHLDTVGPGKGIKPIEKDGAFYSSGDTILGADDKAAIAAMLEAATVLHEQKIDHPPFELLFTVCEEIGLLGAKAFDVSLLNARMGYALDAKDPTCLITNAPQAIRYVVKIIGKAAHAGASPEKGISAIQLAAKAISIVPQGKIDEETTANVGVIHGGRATNIIAEEVVIDGEVRSHDVQKLKKTQDAILGAFQRVVAEFQSNVVVERPVCEIVVSDDYPVMAISPDHPLVQTARNAARAIGIDLTTGRTGGGSDANIFNGKGLSCAVMGVGMQNVHSTAEFVKIDDMARCCELMCSILSLFGSKQGC